MTSDSGLTPERLAEIRARCESASPGPWHYGPGNSVVLLETGIIGPDGEAILVNCGRGAGAESEEDGVFIAHARIDVPDLLAEVERLRSRVQELEGRSRHDE